MCRLSKSYTSQNDKYIFCSSIVRLLKRLHNHRISSTAEQIIISEDYTVIIKWIRTIGSYCIELDGFFSFFFFFMINPTKKIRVNSDITRRIFKSRVWVIVREVRIVRMSRPTDRPIKVTNENEIVKFSRKTRTWRADNIRVWFYYVFYPQGSPRKVSESNISL